MNHYKENSPHPELDKELLEYTMSLLRKGGQRAYNLNIWFLVSSDYEKLKATGHLRTVEGYYDYLYFHLKERICGGAGNLGWRDISG